MSFRTRTTWSKDGEQINHTRYSGKDGFDVYLINADEISPKTDTVINEFDEALAVAASTETEVINYLVPTDKTLQLFNIDCSGCNVAKYTIVINNNTEAVKRSYWCDFNVEFLFNGLNVQGGQRVIVKVIHERPSAGDFEARINGDLK